MAAGSITLEALQDAAHHSMEIDGGTQFKVFDRVLGSMHTQADGDIEHDALETLLDTIVSELERALSENKE